MSKLVDKILGDDFIWDAVTQSLHGRRKRSGTGFISFDCPMCTQRGTSADTKSRGGVKRSGEGIGVYCFNCGFRSKFVPGTLLSKSFKSFLLAIGNSEQEVDKLNHRAFSYRSILSKSPEAVALIPDAFAPDWKATPLPDGARTLDEWAEAGCDDPNFLDVVTYLYEQRGQDLAEAYPYAWSPSTKNDMSRRLIIPFKHEGRTVGYSARAIDPGHGQRYHMEAPDNFLFNVRSLVLPNRRYGIFVEGGFDAIGIDGVGLMGARMNAQQAAWIKSFGKVNIIVPDRDKRGQDLIDVALENNWHVAFPALKDGAVGQRWWEPDVKDTAEAVRRYGRLWTLTSLIRSATANKLEINVKRKWLY